MNCSILSTLYVRSNGDIPCHDDAGETIVLGRVQLLEQGWSIEKIVEGPLYRSIRRSLQDGIAPWPGVCEQCAAFRPHEAYADTLTTRSIRTLQIEPSLACNLKCLCCSQPRQITERPKPFRLPLDLFESLLRSLREQDYRIHELEYCGQGEAMTHPQFGEMVQLARDLFPNTRQRLITNGNFDYQRAKLTSALDEIIVSVDGATQQSYERYRVGGTFEKALQFMRNARAVIGERRAQIVWKYILFEFNDTDEEIILAQRLAEAAQVDVLLFVFTHSLHKSERYTLGTAHQLPLVWHRARVVATPVQYQGVRQYVPTEHGWPCENPGRDTRMMVDGVASDGKGELHLHGWVVSARTIGRVRLSHNGTVVGETPLNEPRPDVTAAYPAFGQRDHGFRVSWRERPSIGRHVFDADILDDLGTKVASFSRVYTVA